MMKILLKLLRNYDCSGPVSPGDPGHILMRHMLNNSQFLKKVMITDTVLVNCKYIIMWIIFQKQVVKVSVTVENEFKRPRKLKACKF